MDGEPPSLKKSENAQIKTSTKYLSFNFSWRESIARFLLNMYCLYYKYKCLYLYTIPVFFQESHGFSTKKPSFLAAPGGCALRKGQRVERGRAGGYGRGGGCVPSEEQPLFWMSSYSTSWFY